jgi:hypothetical protein
MAGLKMLVSGGSLREEQVALLADLVAGELGQRLREAAAERCSIMRLSRGERERILASLDDAPWPLVGFAKRWKSKSNGGAAKSDA